MVALGQAFLYLRQSNAMQITLEKNGKKYSADLENPIDISLAVSDLTRAWYINPPTFSPVRLGENWVGSVAEGGNVNFRDINFNPHAHGTHTECLGHVTEEVYSVNQLLKQHWFLAELVTVPVLQVGEDQILTTSALKTAWKDTKVEAIVIRTSPNNPQKATQNLSSTNWPFLEEAAAVLLRERGIKHLLIDQPSVDKEEDGGALAAHKAFWNIPESPCKNATITELIFVPDHIADGLYLLNLQVAPIENDASPSRPVLFKVFELEG